MIQKITKRKSTENSEAIHHIFFFVVCSLEARINTPFEVERMFRDMSATFASTAELHKVTRFVGREQPTPPSAAVGSVAGNESTTSATAESPPPPAAEDVQIFTSNHHQQQQHTPTPFRPLIVIPVFQDGAVLLSIQFVSSAKTIELYFVDPSDSSLSDDTITASTLVNKVQQEASYIDSVLESADHIGSVCADKGVHHQPSAMSKNSTKNNYHLYDSKQIDLPTAHLSARKRDLGTVLLVIRFFGLAPTKDIFAVHSIVIRSEQHKGQETKIPHPINSNHLGGLGNSSNSGGGGGGGGSMVDSLLLSDPRMLIAAKFIEDKIMQKVQPEMERMRNEIRDLRQRVEELESRTT